MSGPSRADHEKFFSDTFVPITSASGTQYDSCRYEDILAYTSATNGPKCCLPKRFSTWVLTKYLTERWPNERARDALHRINQAISTPNWGPDLLVKLMPDLDTAFFNSRLRTHVQVAWKDESSIVFMDEDTDTLFPNALGLTLFNSVNNSSYIFLNRDNVCHGKPDPRVAMLQTLVHEMVVSNKQSTCPLKMCLQHSSMPRTNSTAASNLKTLETLTKTTSPRMDGTSGGF